jgi:hypothetical protein
LTFSTGRDGCKEVEAGGRCLPKGRLVAAPTYLRFKDSARFLAKACLPRGYLRLCLRFEDSAQSFGASVRRCFGGAEGSSAYATLRRDKEIGFRRRAEHCKLNTEDSALGAASHRLTQPTEGNRSPPWRT